LLACLTVLITTATLLAASDDRPQPLLQLRRAGLMLAQSLPFMLLLFLLFPGCRAAVGHSAGSFSAVSGLSDTMSPGSIALLSQSDAIAFRVKFKGDVPPQSQLYWRGPVMPSFDGRSWRVRQTLGAYPEVPYVGRGAAVEYEVTLERMENSGCLRWNCLPPCRQTAH